MSPGSGQASLGRQIPVPTPRASQQVVSRSPPMSPPSCWQSEGCVQRKPPRPPPPPLPPPPSEVQKNSGPQNLSAGQLPHSPPHPSGPQCFPAQLGMQTASHLPWTSQLSPIPHCPQTPLHPSNPHSLFTQDGMHPLSGTQALLFPQISPPPHWPQMPPQPSLPHSFPRQAGMQPTH